MVGWIILAVVVIIAILILVKSIRVIPQARAGIVERFGKYRASLSAGLNIITPFVDRVRYKIDLREQVVSFPPQPVITEDNLVVSIDTVIYFQVTNPVAATYEIANYIQAIEQLTMTTLRNIIGGMDLEQTLTSRDEINSRLRGVLDEATGRWGIRVNRVELKGIDPPPSIKDAMEKQMRADRDKRAAVLTAEGMRQSQILTAEGQKQSAILTAEGDREALVLRAQGDRQSRILRAQGEGQAILTVFQSIHDGSPDQALLAYQYLQMLPKVAEGDANKVWIVPSEIGQALKGLGSTLGSIQGVPSETDGPKKRVDYGEPVEVETGPDGEPLDASLSTTHDEVAEAIAEAAKAAQPGAGRRKAADDEEAAEEAAEEDAADTSEAAPQAGQQPPGAGQAPPGSGQQPPPPGPGPGPGPQPPPSRPGQPPHDEPPPAGPPGR
ncbi:MAG: SPFH domain-containing protein [Nocardioidaceae bacterium]